jgi:hypothetical protein
MGGHAVVERMSVDPCPKCTGLSRPTARHEFHHEIPSLGLEFYSFQSTIPSVGTAVGRRRRGQTTRNNVQVRFFECTSETTHVPHYALSMKPTSFGNLHYFGSLDHPQHHGDCFSYLLPVTNKLKRNSTIYIYIYSTTLLLETKPVICHGDEFQKNASIGVSSSVIHHDRLFFRWEALRFTTNAETSSSILRFIYSFILFIFI